MSVINLLPPVQSDNLDVVRLQQRFEAPMQALISSPWGDGVLVIGISLPATSGTKTITIRHGLGRKATGCVLWNCTVPVLGPWQLAYIDINTCSVSVSLTSEGGGMADFWVG